MTAWLHPSAGWRTATEAPVSSADFLAMLDSGDPAEAGSEPRLRIRGDSVKMTAVLYASLGDQTVIEDDFTEIQWLRVVAPQAAAAQMTAALTVPADGVVQTLSSGLAEVTVQIEMARGEEDVGYFVRPFQPCCLCLVPLHGADRDGAGRG